VRKWLAARREKDIGTLKKQKIRQKKKVDEKAYENALKNIPASTDKPDPWKSMR